MSFFWNQWQKTVYSVVIFFLSFLLFFSPLYFSLFGWLAVFITSSYVFLWGITSYCSYHVCLSFPSRSSFIVFFSFFSFHFTYRLLFILTCFAWLMLERPECYCYFPRQCHFQFVKMIVCVHIGTFFISISYLLVVVVVVVLSAVCYSLSFLFTLLCLVWPACLPPNTLVFWFNVINFKQRLNAEKTTTANSCTYTRIREQFNNH